MAQQATACAGFLMLSSCLCGFPLGCLFSSYISKTFWTGSELVSNPGCIPISCAVFQGYGTPWSMNITLSFALLPQAKFHRNEVIDIFDICLLHFQHLTSYLVRIHIQYTYMHILHANDMVYIDIWLIAFLMLYPYEQHTPVQHRCY